MSDANPLVSIVVPTFQEAENIPLLVPRVCDGLAAADLPGEIIIVDDNSRDGSAEAVEELRRQGLPVRIEVRTKDRGLSSAVIHGFRQARGEFLLCMDADLSHPPERIPDMVAPLQSGTADFVLASRYLPGASIEEGWGLLRWLNSAAATLLARPLTSVTDPMSGFFALPRARFETAAQLSPIGYKIALELLVKADCRRVAEVPIHFARRAEGESKLSLREQVKYVQHVLRLYRYKLFGSSGRAPYRP